MHRCATEENKMEYGETSHDNYEPFDYNDYNPREGAIGEDDILFAGEE